MGIKGFRDAALIFLAAMLLLSAFSTSAIAAAQTQQEEQPQPWEFFREEAGWGSAFALIAWTGYELLKPAICHLVCYHVGVFCWNGCEFTLAYGAYLGIPFVAALGVVWNASQHGVCWNSLRTFTAYRGALLGELGTIYLVGKLIMAYELAPLTDLLIGKFLLYSIISIAEGLGAAYALNLQLEIETKRGRRASFCQVRSRISRSASEFEGLTR